MKLFLKAKHWQLFVLFFGIPFTFQIVIMVSIFTSHNLLFSYFKFIPIIMVVYASAFLGWFWSIGLGLQPKVPETVKMNIALFKTFLIIPLVYILLISVLIGMVFFNTNFLNSLGLQPMYFLLIVPLHLFCIFCMFYCLYFVAKTYKTVELQRKVSFEDFAGEFFMLWFFPIGIWIMQPKINKMAGN